MYERDYAAVPSAREAGPKFRTEGERAAYVAGLERRMREAAADLDFEQAATLRDEIRTIKRGELGLEPARNGR